MIKRLILPVAALLLTSACQTDSAAPQWIDLPANLNLGLPQLRQLTEARPRDMSEEPQPATPGMLASMQIEGEELPDEYEQVMGAARLISDPAQADAAFLPSHGVVYGQALGTSKGSFYENFVRLQLRRGGTFISEISEDESESCNCAHLFNPWGRTANVTIAVAGDCGLSASAYAKHKARLEWTTASGRVFTLLTDSDAGSHHASQPSCPPVQPGGGADPDGYYICYWEDFYDAYGNFSHRIDLGCMPLNVY